MAKDPLQTLDVDTATESTAGYIQEVSTSLSSDELCSRSNMAPPLIEEMVRIILCPERSHQTTKLPQLRLAGVSSEIISPDEETRTEFEQGCYNRWDRHMLQGSQPDHYSPNNVPDHLFQQYFRIEKVPSSCYSLQIDTLDNRRIFGRPRYGRSEESSF